MSEETVFTEFDSFPSFEEDRSVEMPGEKVLNASDSYQDEQPVKTYRDQPQVKKPGAKPLGSYLEPDDYEAYGFTQEKILENYRFYGTLMKRDKGHFRLKERIAKSNAKNIEEIEDIYGSGHYQLRVETADGGEDRIDFQVVGSKEESDQPQQQAQSYDTNYYQSLRRELMQEARDEMKTLIDQLETRLRLKDSELDEKSRKVRELSEEIGQLQRNAYGQAQTEIDRLRDKIDDLKTDIQNKDMEILRLEMDLEYSGIETDGDWFDKLERMMEKALENPALAQMIGPMLSKMAQAQPAAAAQAELSGPRPVQQRANPEPSPQNSQNQSSMNDAQPQPAPAQMTREQILDQITDVLYEHAEAQLTAAQPNAQQIITLITQLTQEAKQFDIEKIPDQVWTDVAQKVVNFALEEKIEAERLAAVISPLVENLGNSKNMLKKFSAKQAASLLIGYLDLNLKEPQKKLMIDVLSVFKEELKQAS